MPSEPSRTRPGTAAAATTTAAAATFLLLSTLLSPIRPRRQQLQHPPNPEVTSDITAGQIPFTAKLLPLRLSPSIASTKLPPHSITKLLRLSQLPISQPQLPGRFLFSSRGPNSSSSNNSSFRRLPLLPRRLGVQTL